MRRTVWTLLIALLLQLVSGSAWALRAAPATLDQAPHCHDTMVQTTTASDTQHAHGKTLVGASHHDSHHCCAVGFGVVMQPLLQPLPQSVPTSRHGPWASLSLRPDLRPPI